MQHAWCCKHHHRSWVIYEVSVKWLQNTKPYCQIICKYFHSQPQFSSSFHILIFRNWCGGITKSSNVFCRNIISHNLDIIFHCSKTNDMKRLKIFLKNEATVKFSHEEGCKHYLGNCASIWHGIPSFSYLLTLICLNSNMFLCTNVFLIFWLVQVIKSL